MARNGQNKKGLHNKTINGSSLVVPIGQGANWFWISLGEYQDQVGPIRRMTMGLNWSQSNL